MTSTNTPRTKLINGDSKKSPTPSRQSVSVTRRSYQEITDTIVGLLEKGIVPWHKPWSMPSSEPQNLISRRPYRGINPFVLNCEPYTSPFWLTYRQATKLGAQVRKGEKSTPIWFWKIWKSEAAEEESEETPSRDRSIPILRRYRVFNAEQCDGLEGKIPELLADRRSKWERIEAAEAIVAGMPNPPQIEHGRRAAFYHPSEDLVGMPHQDHFETDEGYYSTLFHELIHSTGHVSRLNRKGAAKPARFGSPIYSREELVAELGAAFLSGRAGIERVTVEASASYLANWIRRLKGDSTLAVAAGGAAQRAADYILGEQASGAHS